MKNIERFRFSVTRCGRSTHQTVTLALCAITSALVGTAPIMAQTDRPNVLLMVTDDQGYWDLGVHGNETISTPVLDQLAGAGARFTRFYVAPVCAPTRAGLMTGRYAFRTGLYNTRFGGDTMSDEEITLAELLQNAGYRTGLFGKWHLGRYARYQPNNQGFEESLCLLHGHAERYDYPDQLLHNGEPVEARGYITDLFTDAAINYIQREDERPFFCYVAYNVPHSPFITGNAHAQDKPGDELIKKYLKKGVPLREARIYAMIERCDFQIGRLLDLLSETGKADNTIVIFMSDNGGIHGHYTAGLRGRKGSVYEGGVRSPLLVRYPGRVIEGSTISQMVSHVDIVPTIADWVGIPIPKDRPIDGKSVRRLLETGQGRSPHVFVYHSWNRYVPDPDRNWAVSGPKYKLANGRLFDLESDPGEANDVASEHPELVEKLREEYLRWFRETTQGQNYQPVPIEIGRDDENPVEIQMSWARLNGDDTQYVFRGYDWDTIEGWKRFGDSASWRIRIMQPGRYEVTVSYGAAESAGSTFRLSVSRTRLEGVVERTPTRDVFHRKRVGTIELSRGFATLQFEAIEVNGDELMALNRIWLRRIDSADSE